MTEERTCAVRSCDQQLPAGWQFFGCCALHTKRAHRERRPGRSEAWQPFLDKLMQDLDALFGFVTVDGELLMEMGDAWQIFGLMEKKTIDAIIELRAVVDTVRAKEEGKRN